MTLTIEPEPAQQNAATRPLRVLHTISGLESENGGVVTALLGLVEAQADLGVDAHVLSTWQRETSRLNAERLRDRGVEVTHLGPAHGRLSLHPDLRRTVEAAVARADAVVIHALWEQVQHETARACQRAGVPYVVSTCGMLDEWPLRQNPLVKRLFLALRVRKNLRRARALHAATPMEGQSLRRLKLDGPEIVVELLGIELDDFQHLPPRGRFRARHPRLGDRPVVLFLSRLHYKKGIDLLIPGFAEAVRRLGDGPGGDAMLVLAGPAEPEYLRELQELAERSGVGDRVLFPGMLRGADRVSAYVDADVFALTSYAENFGIVVAEAMAAGLPLVVSDQTATHAEVSASGAGTVVPTDVPRIVAALAEWLGDPARRAAAGPLARAHAMETFDWTRNAQHWNERFAAYAREAAAQATARRS